ncbi:MAG: peptidoglycan-associated lipoprotein [Betaproteobacteria bacterium]|nr:peptidoglycan-associated lipoprotein [Betaproteobacteria bacterium]
MHHLFKPFARLPLLAATASVVVLAGCASQVPLDDKKAAVSSATPGSSASAADAATASQIAAAKAALGKVKPSIYFDYDKFEIKSEYQPTITAEYNLALGQKRAEAVSKALGVLGVAANRVEAVSNGEEKPRAKGSTEAAWAENRRADPLLK